MRDRSRRKLHLKRSRALNSIMTRLRDGYAKAPASRGGPEPIGRLALTLKLPPHVSPSGRESASSWRLNPMRSHLRHHLYVWNEKGTQAPPAKKSAYEAGRRLPNNSRSLPNDRARHIPSKAASPLAARLVFQGAHRQQAPSASCRASMPSCKRPLGNPCWRPQL